MNQSLKTNNRQKQIQNRLIISFVVLLLYVSLVLLLVEPQPVLGYFVFYFFVCSASIIVGVLVLIGALAINKAWTGSILFILTAMINVLILLIDIFYTDPMDSNSRPFVLFFYLGTLIGFIQSYLLVKYFLASKQIL